MIAPVGRIWERPCFLPQHNQQAYCTTDRELSCSWHSLSVRQKRGAFHGLRFEELLREQVHLPVPPTHPLAQRRSVSLDDAAREPFVGLTREDFPDYNAYLASIFAPVKNKPR